MTRRAPFVGADDTGFRVGGENSRLCAFTHPAVVVSVIADARGHEAVDEFFESYRGMVVWGGWKPYDTRVEAMHLLDLRHATRWLLQAEVRHRVQSGALPREVEAMLDSAGKPPEEFLKFANGGRRILRSTVRGADARPETSSRARRRAARAAPRAKVPLTKEDYRALEAARILRELRRHRRMLFTFLEVPECHFIPARRSPKRGRGSIIGRSAAAAGRGPGHGCWNGC